MNEGEKVVFLDQEKHDYVQEETAKLAARLLKATGLPVRTALLHMYSGILFFACDKSAYVARDFVETINETNVGNLEAVQLALKTHYEPIERELGYRDDND